MKHLILFLFFTTTLFGQKVETKESVLFKVQMALGEKHNVITPTIDFAEEVKRHNERKEQIQQAVQIAVAPVCDINELTQRIGELYAECIGWVHPDSCQSNLITLGEYSRWWVYWQSDKPDACGKRLTWFEPVKEITCGNFQREHAITAVDIILEWWPPVMRDTCGMYKEE